MQYFLKNSIINKELIIQLCSFLKIIINSSWTINNISINNIQEFITIVKPLYRPCFAKRFIDIINTADDPRPYILTILRQIIQSDESYQLITKERYKVGIGRFIEYSIIIRDMIMVEPIELNFSNKE